MFSFICAWIYGWVNNAQHGDLRRHRDHYNVTVTWNVSGRWYLPLRNTRASIILEVNINGCRWPNVDRSQSISRNDICAVCSEYSGYRTHTWSMVPQITDNVAVCSTAYPDRQHRKHQRFPLLTPSEQFTDDRWIPSTYGQFCENVPIAWWLQGQPGTPMTGAVFCLLLGVSSGCARPITGQVTSVTWPVIGWAYSELPPSKRQKTGPVLWISGLTGLT